ncbi:MAG: hypothetical protein KatS3mg035_0308 [Bacteroidia bacterium]|nr:MAG: hypothetical protein KatS3mg035_0308 [Bacteroidia bacterium]
MSVYFLFFSPLKAFEFQCYQKFVRSQPRILVKFTIPCKQLDFQEIHKQCIAHTELQLQLVKNHRIIFEKRFSKSYQLYDYQDYTNDVFLDSLWIQGIEYGEYQVHFSLEQTHKTYYQNQSFIFENQWYRVNIEDIEIFDKNYFPILHSLENHQDTVLLKFHFESRYSFPLTIRIQVFTAQKEQSNDYAVAYQSIFQQTSTINLKRGNNIKWVKLPIEKSNNKNYFIEINFFEEENFVLSKRIELEVQRDKNIIQKQWLDLALKFKNLGVYLPVHFETNIDELIDIQEYMELLLSKSQNQPQKLQFLVHLGLPDKILHQGSVEEWIYFKYNRRISFKKS